MRRVVLAVLVLAVPANAADPPWVAAMKDVHARYKGTPGTLAMFGDSITVTMAFWAPLQWEPKAMPADMTAALATVKTYMKPDGWAKWKGPKYGSNGGMTIRWADENIDTWLKGLNPETAVILFGTNDLGGLERTEFQAKTAAVVERCLRNGTVVILTTLPPRSGRVEKGKDFADAVREVARAKKVPLIDYQAEILKRRPDDWDGSLPKFKGVKGSAYEVPTLIARDGVHPSYPKAHQDYSADSLSKNGYALRNYLTVLAYAEVIEGVFK